MEEFKEETRQAIQTIEEAIDILSTKIKKLEDYLKKEYGYSKEQSND